MRFVAIDEGLISRLYTERQSLLLVNRMITDVLDADGSVLADGVFEVRGAVPYGKPGDILWVKTTDNMDRSASEFTLAIQKVFIQRGSPDDAVADWCIITDCAVHRINVDRYLDRQALISTMALLPEWALSAKSEDDPGHLGSRAMRNGPFGRRWIRR